METIIAAFRSLGPARIMALFIGIAAVIAISSLVINRAQTPGLALLYGGLTAQEASRITDYLSSQNIPHEVKGDGAIYVPSTQVGTLRLQVAGQGMVGASGAGYELFDNQSSFGTTNFVSNINAKRALEGELARTIGTLPAVSGARVHIVLPKQSLFSREQVTPSAAIALNLGNRTLQPEQVSSIAQLVAAAVPNLTLQNITVIDQRGAMLFNGAETESTASGGVTLRRKLEKTYEDSLTSMLERVVGSGKVSVRVNAELNLDKVAEQAEIFDPTQQVVRSEQTIESTSSGAGSGAGGIAGLQANTPGGASGAAAGGAGGSSESRTETTTNYEITKTTRTLERNGGEVKKLSVAVLVEGKTSAPTEGAEAATQTAPTYTPLSEDEKSRLRTLVQAAVGYNAERGDKVEIIDMPFSAAPEIAAVEEPFITKDQIMNLAQYALMAIALLIVALMVVKPTLSTLNAAISAAAPVIVSNNSPSSNNGNIMGDVGGTEGASTIDMRSVQGRVKESSVKKVNEIIDQYPEESLGVVRNWMNSTPNNQQQG